MLIQSLGGEGGQEKAVQENKMWTDGKETQSKGEVIQLGMS